MRAVHSTRTTQLSMAQHSQHLCYDPLAMQHPLQPTNAPTLRVLCSESAWSLQREPIRFLNSGYSTCVHSTRDEAHVCVCGVSGVVECGYVAETLGACAEVWQCMERVLGQFSPCHVHTSTTHAPPLRPSCEPPNHVSAAACEGGDGGVRNGQNAKLVAAAAAAAGHECVCVSPRPPRNTWVNACISAFPPHRKRSLTLVDPPHTHLPDDGLLLLVVEAHLLLEAPVQTEEPCMIALDVCQNVWLVVGCGWLHCCGC